MRSPIDDNPYSKRRGQLITKQTIDMYQICDHLVKPISAPFKSSWVEVLATTGPQFGIYFLSHAWANPFSETIEMLDYHAEVKGLTSATTYWFCVFANVSDCPRVLWLRV